jgi:cytidyltransferase-like protein
MRVGIFAGGFKPFHIGHFSRLCQAIDSCDKTYVFYGTAARQKGSKFNFTEQDATAVFDITSRAIKKTYGAGF